MRNWVGVGEDDTGGDEVEVGCMLIRSTPNEVILPHAVSSETLETWFRKTPGLMEVHKWH